MREGMRMMRSIIWRSTRSMWCMWSIECIEEHHGEKP